MTAFFVSDGGGRVSKPIIVWKRRKPHCFRQVNAAAKDQQMPYFLDAKSLMQFKIKEKVLIEIQQHVEARGQKSHITPRQYTGIHRKFSQGIQKTSRYCLSLRLNHHALGH